MGLRALLGNMRPIGVIAGEAYSTRITRRTQPTVLVPLYPYYYNSSAAIKRTTSIMARTATTAEKPFRSETRQRGEQWGRSGNPQGVMGATVVLEACWTDEISALSSTLLGTVQRLPPLLVPVQSPTLTHRVASRTRGGAACGVLVCVSLHGHCIQLNGNQRTSIGDCKVPHFAANCGHSRIQTVSAASMDAASMSANWQEPQGKEGARSTWGR